MLEKTLIFKEDEGIQMENFNIKSNSTHREEAYGQVMSTYGNKKVSCVYSKRVPGCDIEQFFNMKEGILAIPLFPIGSVLEYGIDQV